MSPRHSAPGTGEPRRAALLVGLVSGLLIAGWDVLLSPVTVAAAPSPVALFVWLAAAWAAVSFGTGRPLMLPVACALGPVVALVVGGLPLTFAGGQAGGWIMAVLAFAPFGFAAGGVVACGRPAGPKFLGGGLVAGVLLVVLAPGPWLLPAGMLVLPILAAWSWWRLPGPLTVEVPPARAATVLDRSGLVGASGAALLLVAVMAWGQLLMLTVSAEAVARAMIAGVSLAAVVAGSWLARWWRGRHGSAVAMLVAAGFWNLAATAFYPWLLALSLRSGWEPATRALVLALCLLLPLLALVTCAWLAQRNAGGETRAVKLFPAWLGGSALGVLLYAGLVLAGFDPARLLLFAAAALPLGLALPAVLITREFSGIAVRFALAGLLVVAGVGAAFLPTIPVALMASGLNWQPERFYYAGRPALEDALGRQLVRAARPGLSGFRAVRQPAGEAVVLTWQGWSLSGPTTHDDLTAAAIPALLAGGGSRAAVFGDRGGRLSDSLSRVRPDLDISRFELFPGLDGWGAWEDSAVPVGGVSAHVQGDGWDLAMIQPLPPRVAASGLPYSLQAMRSLRQALAPGGLAAVRLRAEALNRLELHRILVTFATTFPDASLWFTGMDLVLLGAEAAPAFDLTRFERRFRQAAGPLAPTGLNRPLDLLARCIMSGEAMRALALEVPAETRFWPRLAFDGLRRDLPRGWEGLGMRATVGPGDLLARVSDGTALPGNMEEDLGAALQVTDLWLQMLALSTVDLPRALAMGQAATQLRPEDPAVGSALARLAYEAYGAALEAGLPADARVMAELAVEMEPGSEKYQLALYDQLLRAGAGAAAQRRLAEMASRFPGSYPVLLAQTRRRLDQDDVNAADTLLRRAEATGYQTPALHLARARVALARGQEALARFHVRRALRQAPESGPVLADLGISLIQRDPGQAESYLRRARDAGQDGAAVLASLAELVRRRGDFHDAVELLEQASGKEPDNPRLRLQLGRALLQAGETGRAVNELLAARERAPGLADIRLHLAVAFLRDGRVDEARSELQTIGPRLADDPMYQRLREELLP